MGRIETRVPFLGGERPKLKSGRTSRPASQPATVGLILLACVLCPPLCLCAFGFLDGIFAVSAGRQAGGQPASQPAGLCCCSGCCTILSSPNHRDGRNSQRCAGDRGTRVELKREAVAAAAAAAATLAESRQRAEHARSSHIPGDRILHCVSLHMAAAAAVGSQDFVEFKPRWPSLSPTPTDTRFYVILSSSCPSPTLFVAPRFLYARRPTCRPHR